MPGRHQLAPVKRPKGRFLAAIAGVAVAASTALAFFPASANADTSVDAQLSLSGVATKSNVLGGSEVGIHPGDTVNFKAAAVPTAGLQNIPALGSLLDNLLGSLGSKLYQVEVHFGAAFPGGAQTVKLGGPTSGKCAGVAAKPVRFPAKGTYSFNWTVKYIAVGLLGGCTESGLNSTQLNQLQQAGVALNSSNQWVGKIVVADNPPKGGISIQLPGVSVAPNVGGQQLPTVGVPGVNVPTVPVTIPSVKVPGLPGGGKSTAPAGGSTSSDANVLPVPARVVPHGDGDAVYGNVGGGYLPGVLPATSGQGGGGSANLVPGSGHSASAAAPQVQQDSTGKHKTIDLAASKADSTGQFSVILAIVAVVALSVVAATYARLYLLRKES